MNRAWVFMVREDGVRFSDVGREKSKQWSVFRTDGSAACGIRRRIKLLRPNEFSLVSLAIP